MAKNEKKRKVRDRTVRDPQVMSWQELKRQARKRGITVQELLKRSSEPLSDFLKRVKW